MNDKIKELAEQANVLKEYTFVNDATVWKMDPSIEKFAELIVRECAEFIKEWERYQVDMAYHYIANYQIVNFPTGGDSELKEHFGIEQ